MQLTIILCTHNPRGDHLSRVLAALEGQKLPKHQWELLIVDSNSSEQLCHTWDLSWHPNGRHLRTTANGKLAALLLGIREAAGEVMITVDDDTLLEPDYLHVSQRKCSEFPKVGVWSGVNIGEFEFPPAPWSTAFLPFLALNHESVDRISADIEETHLPIGAGMVMQRCVADSFSRYNNQSRVLSGAALSRAAGKLNAGQEDTEVGIIAVRNGFACGRTPDLKLTHLIPQRRLQAIYLMRLAYSIGYSHACIYRSHGIRQKQWRARNQFGPLFIGILRTLAAVATNDSPRMGRGIVLSCVTLGRLRAAALP